MARPKAVRVLVIGVLAVGGLVILSIAIRLLFNRPPFLIVLQPVGKNTVVQFVQPIGFDDKMSVSPMFMVKESIPESFQTALTSRFVQIPGAVIEHGDTTILPGAFNLRFGDTLFQVHSTRIVVNGRDYDWLVRPVDPGTAINASK